MLNILGIMIIGLFLWIGYKFYKRNCDLYIPVPRTLEPRKWGTGDRYLQGDFMTEYELEEMRAKVDSTNSKF